MTHLAHISVRVLAVVMFATAIWLISNQIVSSPVIVGTELRIGQLRAEIAAVERESQSLRDLIAYRQSDNYIVAAAKRELGLVEPGDIQIVLTGFPPPPAPAAAAIGDLPSEPSPPEPSPGSNLRGWWKILSGS